MSQIQTKTMLGTQYGKLESTNDNSDQLQYYISKYLEYYLKMMLMKQEMKVMEQEMNLLMLPECPGPFIYNCKTLKLTECRVPQGTKWGFLYYKPTNKSDNQRYILFAIELGSGFINLRAIAELTGKTIANFICQIYHTYQVTEIIIDDEVLPDAKYINQICHILNLHKKSAYNSQLIKYQTKFMAIFNDVRRQDLAVRWGDCLPIAQNKYNNILE